MTREAITNLEMISVAFVEPVTKEQRKLIDDTFDMAIKALEQEPCKDAISRDMALEKMADYVASGYADSVEDFEEYSRIICQLPPVKPQEPKTGHWIGDNQAFWIYAKCSECGSVHNTATNYCPNCGCLMDRTEFDEYVKTEGA